MGRHRFGTGGRYHVISYAFTIPIHYLINGLQSFESFLYTSNLAVDGLKVCIRQTVWLCVHHNPPGQPEPRHAQVQELRPPGPDPPPLLVLGEGGRQLQPPGR